MKIAVSVLRKPGEEWPTPRALKKALVAAYAEAEGVLLKWDHQTGGTAVVEVTEAAMDDTEEVPRLQALLVQERKLTAALEEERDEARRLLVEFAWSLEPAGDGGQMRREWKNRLLALDWFLPLTDAMESPGE